MSDTVVRHMVAIIATLICLMAYYAGYVSGIFGWWWTAIVLIAVYGGVYKIIHK